MSCILCLEQNISSDLIDVGDKKEGQSLISKLILIYFPLQICKDTDQICKTCWRKIIDFHQLCCFVKERQVTQFDVFDVCVGREYEAALEVNENKLNADNKCKGHTYDEEKPPTETITKKSIPVKTTKVNRKIIEDHCKMVCKLCPTAFQAWPDVDAHYKTAHKINGFVHCICCDKKFYRKGRLLDHVELNANPDAFKCSVCNKRFGHRDALKIHQFQHLPSEEKPYSCDKCTRKFTHRYTLKQHMQIGHWSQADKKMKCLDCGKCFLTKAILNNHVRVAHQGVYTKLCDICAKSFNTKLSYESHVRNVHSSTPAKKIQCKICSKWFKTTSIYGHVDICKSKMEKKEFACEICHKTYPNLKALSAHKNHVHVKQNIYQCTVCEKAFKRPLALKEHMAGHTGQVLYTCPHCPKTCNNSSNMYQHKKTHLK